MTRRRLGRVPVTLRRIAVVIVAGTLCAALSSSTAEAATATNPLAGARFYVDPASPVAQAARTATPAQAKVLRRIAAVPMSRWFGDWVPVKYLTAAVSKYVAAAAKAKRVPTLVLYDIPDRDCDSYSGGGAPDAAAYEAFVRAFAAGLGRSRSVVIVEPDALAQVTCLSVTRRVERIGLIRYAVDRIGAHHGALAYLDAGNSRFTSPADIAPLLTRAGVGRVAGFALNVANFYSAAEETTYGTVISRLTGGAHFVIDTSRNGNGPATGGLAWCNPHGRALGHVPTTNTGSALVDAWLWVKTPGQSDGACHAGDPPAGTFWTAYAIGLADGSS